jgi:poly-gamma-glutamate capsule biosynthesis protein CapA/YwtB (metallophosphatase superfamily)
MATILIGADLCPIEGNLACFKNGDATSLFHDLLPEFEAADLVVANLECPLIEKASPIPKTGPVFGESSACIHGIKQAGIDVLALANNHILDHGAAGLENTLAVCAQAGLATVGAGKDLAAARRILVRSIQGLRVGLLAVAEHEFSTATAEGWGANPLDLIDFVRNVTSHRNGLDYLVVLLHGGDEFFVPSPRLKDTCHFMIEMGANAVIVQHPHCLGGYEKYRGGHLVYGQGALVLDEALYRDRKTFHEGFLVKLMIGQDARSTMELVPFVQSDPAPGARRMQPEQERELRHRLEERSKAVLDDGFVQAQWRKFCEEEKHGYLSALLGHGRLLRALNARGWVERFLYDRDSWLGVRNIVSCETHREAIETIFQKWKL